MAYWIFTLFVFLHGLVHLFYLAWSQGRLIPEEGFNWSPNSWAFTTWLGEDATRRLGMLLFGAAALLFVVAVVGLATSQGWTPSWLTAATAFSTLTILLMWDGQFSALADKGFVGLLVNLGLFLALYGFGFPRL